MGRIFISYRRSDSEADAGRLYSDLAGKFGNEAIFKDVDNVPLGANVRQQIEAAMDASDVVLVVIGPHWQPERLTEAQDWVRVEIESALKRDLFVLPVRVRRAELPPPEALPPSIRGLVMLNAAELEHGSWSRDLAPVIRVIESERAKTHRSTAEIMGSRLDSGPRQLEVSEETSRPWNQREPTQLLKSESGDLEQPTAHGNPPDRTKLPFVLAAGVMLSALFAVLILNARDGNDELPNPTSTTSAALQPNPAGSLTTEVSRSDAEIVDHLIDGAYLEMTPEPMLPVAVVSAISAGVSFVWLDRTGVDGEAEELANNLAGELEALGSQFHTVFVLLGNGYAASSLLPQERVDLALDAAQDPLANGDVALGLLAFVEQISQ